MNISHDHADFNLTRRQSIAAAVGIFGSAIIPAALLPDNAKAAGPHPDGVLFKAIEVHKAAQGAVEAYPGPAEDAEFNELVEWETLSFQLMLDAVPRTMDGLRTYIAYVVNERPDLYLYNRRGVEAEDHDNEAMMALATIARAISAPAMAPPVVAVSDHLLETYHAWLHFETRLVEAEKAERYQDARRAKTVVFDNAGGEYHHADYRDYRTAFPASHRALAVLNAVGCDWRRDA